MKPESRWHLTPRARVFFHRFFTLDGLFALALVVFFLSSLFTAVNVVRLLDSSETALQQHRTAQAAANRAQVQATQRTADALTQLEVLIRRELARALDRHDARAARQHAEMLRAIERLLNRPATVRVVENGDHVVIRREPVPTPCHGRECKRKP